MLITAPVLRIIWTDFSQRNGAAMVGKTIGTSWSSKGLKWFTGWWYTYPSEKWWSSSVGMMKFPIYYGNIKKCSKPPTRICFPSASAKDFDPPCLTETHFAGAGSHHLCCWSPQDSGCKCPKIQNSKSHVPTVFMALLPQMNNLKIPKVSYCLHHIILYPIVSPYNISW